MIALPPSRSSAVAAQTRSVAVRCTQLALVDVAITLDEALERVASRRRGAPAFGRAGCIATLPNGQPGR